LDETLIIGHTKTKKMKRTLQISIGILLAALICSSCHKDSLFKGTDNDIASFQLRKGDLVLKAYILNDSIIMTVPGNFPLTDITPVIVLSEHAQISPDPAAITDWEQSHEFLVTSYNGAKKTYTYILKRNVISKDGDITLMTQADVDTLAKMKLNTINGSLTIGRLDGPDSISSLAGLSSIKNISFDLVINPTYTGKDLKGLDSLETVGTFRIGQDFNTSRQGAVMNLKTISLPKLTEVRSNMIVNGVGITSVDLPELTKIDLGLQIVFVDSLTKIAFPKLQTVLQSIIFQGYYTTNSLQTISFPALENIGGDLYITQWTNLETVKLPALTRAGSVSILGFSLLTSITAPRLKTVLSNVDFSYNGVLTQLDVPALEKIGGGLKIESSTALEDLNGLRSLSSIGGDLSISYMPVLKDISGLKKLQTVGGNFTLQSIDQLADQNLETFSSLGTIGGDVILATLPFKKFSGFGTTKLQSVSVFGSGVSTIEEIDLSRITISTKVVLNGITNGATVKGPAVMDGSLTLDGSDINLEGFSQVKDFTFTWYDDPAPSPVKSLPIQKVTNSVNIGIAGFTKFSFPSLEEVDGICNIQIYSKMDLDMPLFKKAGSLIMNLANSNMNTFSLPLLATVDGDCTFITGNANSSVGDIQAPALTTVGGMFNVSGQESYLPNTRMTSLNGFSALTSAQGVTISYNQALIDFSGLKNVIPSITSGKWLATGNGYDPGYQDMVDGKYEKPWTRLSAAQPPPVILIKLHRLPVLMPGIRPGVRLVHLSQVLIAKYLVDKRRYFLHLSQYPWKISRQQVALCLVLEIEQLYIGPDPGAGRLLVGLV
jgi:hypothetical protein